MSKKIFAVAFVGAIACVALFAVTTPTRAPISTLFEGEITEDQQAFINFMQKFNRVYNDADEFHYRYRVFSDSYRKIQQENLKNSGSTLGVTQFADLTPEEFKSTYLGYVRDERNLQHESLPMFPRTGYAPKTVDWRTEKDVVQHVKDQGQCGSCWAFSAVGAVESAHAIAEKELLDLSEEQVVDCCNLLHGCLCFGCNGGQMTAAINYIKKGGITDQDSYPYHAGKDRKGGKCHKFSPVVKIKGQNAVQTRNIEAMEEALAVEPLSVGVDASTWQLYTGGVHSCTGGIQLNHGVLGVGYTADAWIIKNSWGTMWGESGFIRVSKKNDCGATSEPVGVEP